MAVRSNGNSPRAFEQLGETGDGIVGRHGLVSKYRMAMRHLLSPVVAILVLAAAPMQGQEPPAPVTAPAQPARAAAPASSPGTRLPVRRVVLYKSGVGYFEHLGRVRGNQTVTIDFTSGQLDDVLKSLTTLDLDGGRVLGVSYNSEAALDRRLGALRLPRRQQATRARASQRAARREARGSRGATMLGRLLSVERIEQASDGGVDSDRRAVARHRGRRDSDRRARSRRQRADRRSRLNQEVAKYLSLVASARDQDVRRLTIATMARATAICSSATSAKCRCGRRRIGSCCRPRPKRASRCCRAGRSSTTPSARTGTNVELSLVAGAPQSFVQAISRPLYVQRPVVPLAGTHVDVAADASGRDRRGCRRRSPAP